MSTSLARERPESMMTSAHNPMPEHAAHAEHPTAAPAPGPAPHEPVKMRLAHLQLMRPKQWIKNFFVFAPLIFSGQFLQPGPVMKALVAFGLFTAASSATYIINDLHDIEKDRAHPRKRFKRPLAAGAVTPGTAKIMAAVLIAVVLSGFYFQPATTTVIAGYQILNVLYSWKLKHTAVVEIFTLASGFVLRVYAGAYAIDVPVSAWMMITTLCLALYLAIIKRRQELTEHGSGSRKVLGAYTIPLLDQYAMTSSIGAIVFFSLFVVQHNQKLAMTVPLVLFGFFRYQYLVHRTGQGESPTDVLWQDMPLAGVVLAWVALATWAVWPG